MNYSNTILAAANDPAALETIYRQAVKTNQSADFTRAILDTHSQDPQNLLLTAWYYRLNDLAKAGRVINWKVAVMIAILNGLILGLFAWSDQGLTLLGRIPYLFIFAGPSTGLAVVAYLYFSQTERKNLRLAGITAAVLAAALLYIFLLVPNVRQLRDQAADQTTLHLVLLSLSAIGVYLVGFGKQNPEDSETSATQRFAFLLKALEVLTVSGLALIAGGIFFMVTIGLFSTLNIEIPDELGRFMAAGGVGMIPVLAVAWMYDPQLSPAQQDFQQGVSKILAVLVRALVAPTLLVGLIYVVLIPFNFLAPFENRDVLISYNAMLFAVMALLLGAVPLKMDELSGRSRDLLRYGLNIIAGLAVIVSLYALSAILYRTFLGGLTINRLVVIGWNLINTLLLVGMIYLQFRPQPATWVDAIKRMYGIGSAAYIAWGLAVVFVLPLLFLF